jgi:hypothetical protein
MQTIEQRCFLRRMRVANLLEPLRMTFRPDLYSQWRTATGTQQELRQPVLRSQLIALGCFSRTDKIA